MNNANEVFHTLIHPLSETEFIANYFEQKPFISRGGRLPLIFGLEKFERLLWSHEKELGDRVRLNKSGKAAYYVRERDGMDMFALIMDQFRNGHTVICNGVETIDPEAAAIALSLNQLFGGPTSVNAFLTPPGAQGFLPHFDTHDVFVFQVEGSKTWNLFDGQVTLPLDQQIYLVDQSTLGKPFATYDLQAGDVLYVPRGIIHGANTAREHSLHLTIGIRPLLTAQYLKAMLDALSLEDPGFRTSHVPKERTDYTTLIDKLRSAVDDPYFIKKVKDNGGAEIVSRGRPVPGHHLRNLVALPDLQVHSVLRKAFPGKAVIANYQDKVRLYIPGLGFSGDQDMLPGHITFDAIAYGALNFINTQEGDFRIADMPDFYDEGTRLMIASELVAKGFLKIMETG